MLNTSFRMALVFCYAHPLLLHHLLRGAATWVLPPILWGLIPKSTSVCVLRRYTCFFILKLPKYSSAQVGPVMPVCLHSGSPLQSPPLPIRAYISPWAGWPDYAGKAALRHSVLQVYRRGCIRPRVNNCTFHDDNLWNVARCCCECERGCREVAVAGPALTSRGWCS